MSDTDEILIEFQMDRKKHPLTPLLRHPLHNEEREIHQIKIDETSTKEEIKILEGLPSSYNKHLGLSSCREAKSLQYCERYN